MSTVTGLEFFAADSDAGADELEEKPLPQAARLNEARTATAAVAARRDEGCIFDPFRGGLVLLLRERRQLSPHQLGGEQLLRFVRHSAVEKVRHHSDEPLGCELHGLVDAGEPSARATGVSSKPTRGSRPSLRSPRNTVSAPRARESEAQTSAVAPRCEQLSRWLLRPAGRRRRRRGREPAEPGRSLTARAHPARRSSPTPDPAGQPRKPIRVWPSARSDLVAASVPTLPSTSTQQWLSPRSPHGRPNATNGTRGREEAGRTGVAGEGVGEDGDVDR